MRILFDYLEAGDSLDKFLASFPSVSREQAIAALELAREVISFRAKRFGVRRRQPPLSNT
jgi:uncharacterized protein (DUF433 family)